jgi:flavin reductase (DIM6/NTAB) family NADH-FMN oxidoreductase RutF/DNA-binding MarR family transcriptional regulator
VTQLMRTEAVEHGDPTQDLRAFRRCLGQFSTGVTVMTTICGGKPVGITVNSFASLSLEPPLILWSIATTSRSFSAFEQSTHFAVNVLAVEQVDLSQRFASSAEDRFEGVAWSAGAGGAPILADILASLECETDAVREGGDHAILIGRVTRYVRFSGNALLYSQGRYAVAEDHPTQLIRPSTPSPAAGPPQVRGLHLMALLAYVEMYASDAFDRYRQSEGLNLAQSRSLFALSHGEALPIDEIVRRSYLTRISADDALVSLAERRYVAENEGKFSLTASGRDLFSKLQTQIDRFEAEQLHGISPQDLAATRKVLETLYNRLKPS